MSEYKNLKGLLGKDGKTYVRDTSGSNRVKPYKPKGQGKVGKRRYKEERLPPRDLQQAQQRAAMKPRYDRLTSRDLQQASQRAAYIKAQEQALKQNRDRMTQRDVETFQNDRTRPLPREAYEQVNQELTYPDEVEGKKSGGMIKCKGGRKAIGGTKFTGVK